MQITDKEFEERLANLFFLVGVEDQEDTFGEEYKSLVNAVMEMPEGKYQRLARMKGVFLKELEYEMNLYIKEAKKRAAKLEEKERHEERQIGKGV